VAPEGLEPPSQIFWPWDSASHQPLNKLRAKLIFCSFGAYFTYFCVPGMRFIAPQKPSKTVRCWNVGTAHCHCSISNQRTMYFTKLSKQVVQVAASAFWQASSHCQSCCIVVNFVLMRCDCSRETQQWLVLYSPVPALKEWTSNRQV